MEPDGNATAAGPPTPASSPAPGTSVLARALLAIAAVPALAVTYYFGFSLPAYNRERLEIDRQQVLAEQKRAEMAAQDVAARKQLLDACLQKAGDDYFTYLRLNGTESTDGKISASQDVEAAADKRRRDERESCVRRYGGR